MSILKPFCITTPLKLTPYPLLITRVSRGNWCGIRRSRLGLPSSLGQLLQGRFYPLTISGRVVLLFWIGAACVRGVGSLWTTFSFIVQQIMSCGQWCSVYLGSNELCQRGLLICSQLGRDFLEGTEIQPFGRLCHIAQCGAFGESRMPEVLRVVNHLSLMLKPSSSVPCQIGMWLFILLFVFLFQIWLSIVL